MSATAADPPSAWYERLPRRRAWELDEFDAFGLPASERFDDDGRLIVDTELPFRGEPVAIEVHYPKDFPDFPPTFNGPPNLLDRHQNNVYGNFCVLEDPENDWWPGWSAAELVDVKLRALLADTERGAEAVRAGEADMVESIAAEIRYTGGYAVLVPEPFWAHDLDRDRGDFTLLSLDDDRLSLLTHVDGLPDADPALVERLGTSRSRRRRGSWVHLEPAPPPWPSRSQILAMAGGAHPGLLESARADLARRHRQNTSTR